MSLAGAALDLISWFRQYILTAVDRMILMENILVTPAQCPGQPITYSRTRRMLFLGRPTYLSADLCFTTDSFFLLSFFSPPNLLLQNYEL